MDSSTGSFGLGFSMDLLYVAHIFWGKNNFSFFRIRKDIIVFKKAISCVRAIADATSALSETMLSQHKH